MDSKCLQRKCRACNFHPKREQTLLKERPTSIGVRFAKTTSRIKIERSSTPLPSFLRPSHSTMVDGSYSKWVDAMDERPKTYRIRGHSRPIPGIISGHFVMYGKQQQQQQSKRNRSFKPMAIPRQNHEEDREKLTMDTSRVRVRDSQILEELELELEKRNANILKEILPYMTDAFANLAINNMNHVQNDICINRNAPPPHLQYFPHFVYVPPLMYVPVSDIYA